MKRIKSILTVLMAAVFAFSLVPTGAFASDTDPSDTIANHNSEGETGVLGTDYGTMTIANAKANETYKVYRLFELASFDDEDINTGVHGTNDEDEAYSYVINNDGSNKWYTFLTTQQPVGGAVPYAVLSNAEVKDADNDGTEENDGIYTLDEAATAGYYFVIEAEPITIKDADGNDVATYHVITPTSKFSHAGVTGNNRDDMGDHTDRANAGVSAGDDYVSDSNSNKVVQNFAQEALKYAVANNIDPVKTVTAGAEGGSTTLLASSEHAPLGYYLVGTTMGTLAALDTTNTDVTVYEKNDEPTIEKAILKKGKGFGLTEEDLVRNSMNDQQRRIGALNDEKSRLETALPTMELNSQAYVDAQARIDAIPGEIAAIEAEEPAWVKNTDADVEDYVVFRTVITAQQGARDYRLHDVMEDGLELVTTPPAGTYVTDRYDAANIPAAPKVYLVREGEELTEIEATKNGLVNYVLKTGDDISPKDGCDFEIQFKDATVDSSKVDNDDKVAFCLGVNDYVDIKDGDKIVVVYWARVAYADHDDANTSFWNDDYINMANSNVRDNSNAVLSGQQPRQMCDGNGRNDNHTVLTYGNKSHTQWDKASATVYSFDLAKTDAYDVNDTEGVDEYKLLQGAKFRVYKATTDAQDPDVVSGGISYQPLTDGDTYLQASKALLFTQDSRSTADTPRYVYAGDVATDAVATTPAGTQLVSGKGVAIRLMGLEAGHYILVEEEAPAGYNKLAHPIVVTITDDVDSDGEGSLLSSNEEDNEGYITCRLKANDGSEYESQPVDPEDDNVTEYFDGGTAINPGTYRTHYTSDANGTLEPNGGLRIVNQTGQELPSTGGIGTTIFYVAGTVLVVGAAVMLVAKRRMGAEA